MMQSLQQFARYEAYQDSGVEWLGDIPQSWVVKKLKFLASIYNGQDYKSVLSDDGYPVIGSGGQFAFASQFLYDGEAVLLGRKGTIDKPLYIKGKFWTVDTMFYSVCKNNVFTKYSYYLATTLPFSYYSTATALPSMTQTDLLNHKYALPPLAEQTAIANFLDQKTAEIDQAIALKTNLIERLKEYKQINIQYAVTRGLDPNAKMKASGVEWIGDIPSHWLYELVKHSLHGIIDCEHKTAPFVDETEFLVVRTTNVKNGKLSFEGAKYTNQKSFTEWTRRGVPAPHDVLLTREAPAGEACLVPADTKLCLGQRMVWLKVNKQKIIPSFLLSLIYSTVGRTYIDFLSAGSTVLHLNMSDIKNIPVLLPPLAEQAAIVAHIEAISAKIDQATDQAQQQINTLTEYKTVLINAAVTGKIKVTDDSAQGTTHAQ